MSTIDRLKELEAIAYDGPADREEFRSHLEDAWPNLLAALEAGNTLELRANRAVEFLKSSGHLSEAARLENALKVYAKAAWRSGLR